MTIIEQRFYEQVPNELHKVNENLKAIIDILKTDNNGKDII
jgi:hypothetical protein